jgi:hypothetical protein
MADLELSSEIDALLASENKAAFQASVLSFANGSALRPIPDGPGMEGECSTGYKWQWVNGVWLYRNTAGYISRVLAINGSVPDAFCDVDHFYLTSCFWETLSGDKFICATNTTDNALWEPQAKWLANPGTSYIYLQEAQEQNRVDWLPDNAFRAVIIFDDSILQVPDNCAFRRELTYFIWNDTPNPVTLSLSGTYFLPDGFTWGETLGAYMGRQVKLIGNPFNSWNIMPYFEFNYSTYD